MLYKETLLFIHSVCNSSLTIYSSNSSCPQPSLTFGNHIFYICGSVSISQISSFVAYFRFCPLISYGICLFLSVSFIFFFCFSQMKWLSFIPSFSYKYHLKQTLSSIKGQTLMSLGEWFLILRRCVPLLGSNSVTLSICHLFDRQNLRAPPLEYNIRALLNKCLPALESNRTGRKRESYNLKMRKKGETFVKGQRKKD